MSLTHGQIETLLLDGVYLSCKQREFVAKANSDNDLVMITEMSGRRGLSLPLESVVDRAEVNESGSDVADVAALR